MTLFNPILSFFWSDIFNSLKIKAKASFIMLNIGGYGWTIDQAYRFKIRMRHEPDKTIINAKIWRESELVVDTG